MVTASHELTVEDLAQAQLSMPSQRRRLTGLLGGIAAAARPRQWVKNLLVFAAPAAAGVLTVPAILSRSIAGFTAFCLAASGGYLINDIADRRSDSLHPQKRFRAIASGIVPVPAAFVAGGALLTGGLLVASGLGGPFAALVGAYIALTAAYSKWLKHQPVIDIAVVASGFVTRAISGGMAGGVPISKWFLIVAGAGSLFMVAGKRYAEHVELGERAAELRSTLGEYPVQYLRYVWMLASGIAITSYCLWSFEQSADAGFPWFEVSIVPFFLGMLRYALLLEQGRGSAPEDIVLSDRSLQVIGAAWACLFALGVYLVP